MLSSLLASLLSGHHRLIELSLDGAGPLPLVVERFHGREGISELFRFEIDCLSPDAYLDLSAQLGATATLSLRLADGGQRRWHAHLTQAAQLGSDGGLARYRLVLEPWLAYLRTARDNRIYQDKTVVDVLTELFAAYPFAHWSSQVTQNLRQYSRITQYRESDLDFIQRLLAEEGLSYRFDHLETDGAPSHQLVIFDAQSELPEGAQSLIRYHRADATESSDSLQVWQQIQSTQSNTVSLAGWDYRTLVATSAVAETTPSGALPKLEIHDASRAYPFESSTAAQTHSDLALAHLSANAQRFVGQSSVRALTAATRFTLTQHAGYVGDAARFTVLAVEHHAANNLGAQAAQLLKRSELEAGSYRNRLSAQPAEAWVVPANQSKHVVVQHRALVVGHPDVTLTSDRDHRIKVQFSWQRGAAPNAGGLTADPTRGGNAPGDATSGTWVRVAEWLAGAQWGSHFLPRLGSEVWVDFIDGDIDRPVIVGQAHNGIDLPPFSAGADSDANHPGVISGWMSHNHAAGFNQWLMDDAPGQLRTRLATSEGASQLTLGHLIDHNPDSAQRGRWRGSGFELRTDGWLALRAGAGLLLSATPQADGQGRQLDADDAIARLKTGRERAQALADASHAQGLSSSRADAAPNELLRHADPAQNGHYSGPVGGQETLNAPRFAEPILFAEAPAHLGYSTPASTLVQAGEHLHLTSGADMHWSSAGSLSLASGQASAWFTHRGGIKTIAQSGTHSIQAHAGALELLADRAVTFTSSNAEIHVLAKQKLTLQAGQTAITLAGANLTFACPGTFSVKGNTHAFTGAGSQAAELEALPQGKTDLAPNWIEISHRDAQDQAFAGQAYKIIFEEGQTLRGKLDANGFAHHDNVPPKALRVEYEPRQPEPEKPWEPLSTLTDAVKQTLG